LLIICEEVFRYEANEELLDEEHQMMRKKALGNMRFLGDLFKTKLITKRIAYEVVHDLLQGTDEDKIFGACVFLVLCEGISEGEKLVEIMTRLAELKDTVSSKIKFKIMEVEEAKEANWNSVGPART